MGPHLLVQVVHLILDLGERGRRLGIEVCESALYVAELLPGRIHDHGQCEFVGVKFSIEVLRELLLLNLNPGGVCPELCPHLFHDVAQTHCGGLDTAHFLQSVGQHLLGLDLVVGGRRLEQQDPLLKARDDLTLRCHDNEVVTTSLMTR